VRHELVLCVLHQFLGGTLWPLHNILGITYLLIFARFRLLDCRDNILAWPMIFQDFCPRHTSSMLWPPLSYCSGLYRSVIRKIRDFSLLCSVTYNFQMALTITHWFGVKLRVVGCWMPLSTYPITLLALLCCSI